MYQQQSLTTFYLADDAVNPADLPSLFDVKFWQEKDRVADSAKGRGTTWFLRSNDWWGVDSALRHYYRGGLVGKVNPDYFLWQGESNARSFAEFRLLASLHAQGIAVPRPIAARVIKRGLCYQADLLSERIANAQDLTAILQKQSLPEMSWRAIGELIAKLHAARVNHTDLNAHNILLQGQGTAQEKAFLIDFDKCAIAQGDSWKQGNLERLARSFHKEVARMGIHFSPKDWQALQAGYDTFLTQQPKQKK